MGNRNDLLAKAELPLQKLLKSKTGSPSTEIPVLFTLDLPTAPAPVLDPALDPAVARRTLIQHYDALESSARGEVQRMLTAKGLTVRPGESAQTLFAHGSHEAVLEALTLPEVKGAYLDARLEVPETVTQEAQADSRWRHRVDLRCVCEGGRPTLLLGRAELTEHPLAPWIEVPWTDGKTTAPFVAANGRELTVRRYWAVLDLASLDGWLGAASEGRATVVTEQGSVAIESGPWVDRPAVIDGPKRVRARWALDKVAVLQRALPPERWGREEVEPALRWLIARMNEGGVPGTALGNFERVESLLGPREWPTGLEVTTDIVQRGEERFAKAVHVSFERPLADEKELWVRCRLFNGSVRRTDLLGGLIEERPSMILDELQRWSVRGVLRFEAQEPIDRVEVEVWRARDGALVAKESAPLIRDVSVQIKGDGRTASLVPDLVQRWPASGPGTTSPVFLAGRGSTLDPWRASAQEAERLLAPLQPPRLHVRIPAGETRRRATLGWVAEQVRDSHEATLVLQTFDELAVRELLRLLGEQPLTRRRLVIIADAPSDAIAGDWSDAHTDVDLEFWRAGGAGVPELLVCHDGLGGEKAWLLAPGLTAWAQPFVATVASPTVARSLFEGVTRERIAWSGRDRPPTVFATPSSENPFDALALSIPEEELPSAVQVAEIQSIWDRSEDDAWLLLSALSNHFRDEALRFVTWNQQRVERIGRILETRLGTIGEEILRRVPAPTGSFVAGLERWSRWLDHPDHPSLRAGLHAQTSAVRLAFRVAPPLLDAVSDRGCDRELLALVASGGLALIRDSNELTPWLRSPDVRARSLAAAAHELLMTLRRDWSSLDALDALPPLERLSFALWLARRPGGFWEKATASALEAARRWWPDRLDAAAMAALGETNVATRAGAVGWHWLAQFAKNPEDRAVLIGRFFGAVQAELQERTAVYRLDEWRKLLPEFWTLGGDEQARIIGDWLVVLEEPVNPEVLYDQRADALRRQLAAAYLLAEVARVAPEAERAGLTPLVIRLVERMLSSDWLPVWRGMYTHENLFVALLGLTLPRIEDLGSPRLVPLALDRADTIGVSRPARLALLLCAAPAARAAQIVELANDPATLQSFVALRTQATAWALIVGRWLRAAVKDSELPQNVLPFAASLDRVLPSLPGEQGELVEPDNETPEEIER
ncbi:MAG: hypothetical protein U0325_30230 [Polyangiales bacterium]